MFEKYLHLEKIGNSEVNGILDGTCYIFPKIDGTNASVFWNGETGSIATGSRNRQLSVGSDNAGFHKHVMRDEKYSKFISIYKKTYLFGEWLVPHQVKTYQDEAWRKFYIFDVATKNEAGELEYIHYDIYSELLDGYGFNIITPIATLHRPTEANLIELLQSNTYLIKDNKGIGEGIVIKNYSYKNRYGRYAVAKMISDDFKTKKHIQLDAKSTDPYYLEQQIVNDFCTEHFVKKTYHKILTEADNEWNSKRHIPELIGRVWYDLVSEEMWNILKKYKNSTINFKALNSKVISKIKEHIPEVF